MAWERLQDLEYWEREDHLAADAAFSVASTPEKRDDPRRHDLTEAARDDVAQLYNGSASRASTAGGSGEQTTHDHSLKAQARSLYAADGPKLASDVTRIPKRTINAWAKAEGWQRDKGATV